MENAENPKKSRQNVIKNFSAMKYFIQTDSAFGDWNNQKKEIPEPVYTAIATAPKERANEMVANILGEDPMMVGSMVKWSLIFE